MMANLQKGNIPPIAGGIVGGLVGGAFATLANRHIQKGFCTSMKGNGCPDVVPAAQEALKGLSKSFPKMADKLNKFATTECTRLTEGCAQGGAKAWVVWQTVIAFAAVGAFVGVVILHQLNADKKET